MKKPYSTIHFTIKEIAEFMDCHKNTVINRMKKHNLTIDKLNDLKRFNAFLNDYTFYP